MIDIPYPIRGCLGDLTTKELKLFTNFEVYHHIKVQPRTNKILLIIDYKPINPYTNTHHHMLVAVFEFGSLQSLFKLLLDVLLCCWGLSEALFPHHKDVTSLVSVSSDSMSVETSLLLNSVKYLGFISTFFLSTESLLKKKKKKRSISTIKTKCQLKCIKDNYQNTQKLKCIISLKLRYQFCL